MHFAMRYAEVMSVQPCYKLHQGELAKQDASHCIITLMLAAMPLVLCTCILENCCL